MKKTHFTKDSIGTFRHEFATAIKEFEAATGCKLSLGNISFGAKQFTTKLTVTIVGEGENPDEALHKSALKQHGWKFGISEADFNKRIEFLGQVYALKSVKARKQRFPIVVKRESDGRMYKLPATCLRS